MLFCKIKKKYYIQSRYFTRSTDNSSIATFFRLRLMGVYVSFRCLFYGDINCQKDKSVYLNSILCLFDYFHKEYYQPIATDHPGQNTLLPLVVNTSGWVKGIVSVSLT